MLLAVGDQTISVPWHTLLRKVVCVCVYVVQSPRQDGRGRQWTFGWGRGATGAAALDKTEKSRK